jgi:hypothetical protein
MGVYSLEAVNINEPPQILGNMVRVEVERTNQSEVIDRYEMSKYVKEMPSEGCYAKSCMLELGTKLKADKILTGSVENYATNYVVSLRLLDIRTGSVEKLRFLNSCH